MAAIDKMYLKSYYAFDNFRRWCIIHKPSLLNNFYYWTMNQKEWNDWKEEVYKNNKEVYTNAYSNCSCTESLRQHYKSLDYDASDEQLEYEVKTFLKTWDEIQNKQKYIDNLALPVSNFTLKQDRYLLWHCPIHEVREYLHKHCGYKEKWYYKLFFKK